MWVRVESLPDASPASRCRTTPWEQSSHDATRNDSCHGSSEWRIDDLLERAWLRLWPTTACAGSRPRRLRGLIIRVACNCVGGCGNSLREYLARALALGRA